MRRLVPRGTVGPRRTVGLAWALLLLATTLASGELPTAATIGEGRRAYDDGNYRDAFRFLEAQLLGGELSADEIGPSLQLAVDCLRRLNRVTEFDALLRQVVERQPSRWQALVAVARAYASAEHYGFVVDGQFRRGPQRGGGQLVHCADYDRVRALELFRQAMLLVEEADRRRAAVTLLPFAEVLIFQGDTQHAWRLQELTDLSNLPDKVPASRQLPRAPRGAPVNEQGDPIFYEQPASWQSAVNDGERWRWVLSTMALWNPQLRDEARYQRALFLRSQFGVATLAHEPRWSFARIGAAVDQPRRQGVYALYTLGDHETIARLATGVRRFTLPDEHNPLRLFEQVAEGDSRRAASAIEHLAAAFEHRHQFPRAAEFWQRALERHPDNKSHAQRLQQIRGAWGSFGNTVVQPAGRGATLDFRFRNAKQVEFVARRINTSKLLQDVRQYLASKPAKIDPERIRVERLGWQLIRGQAARYVGREAARWHVDLEPFPDHRDRQIAITTPLQQAGAYLVEARIAEGNECQVVVWISDTALLKKPIDGEVLYFVADAVSGQPLDDVAINVFGYRQRRIGPRKFSIDVAQYELATDENGLAVDTFSDDQERQFHWLTTASSADGRFAYLGFRGVWREPYTNEPGLIRKAYAITDRPVYRPAQKVHFKCWIGAASYDTEAQGGSAFAHQSFAVEISDPDGNSIFKENLTTDGYGGLEGACQLPSAAKLGRYAITVLGHGGGSFRVEEYRKPEYEVVVAGPSKPVALGDTFSATISAEYYFAAPVANAVVRYKVERSAFQQPWYPASRYDWLYGAGYGWFAQQHAAPHRTSRGASLTGSIWPPFPHAQPELVAQRETVIGPDGTLTIEIDTGLAQQIAPDTDHRYQITAEVIDQSRRSVIGRGSVLVSRQPFRVVVWTDRGHYRTGDTIHAYFSASAANGRPVSGHGALTLWSLKDVAGEVSETVVRTWDLPTEVDGRAEIQLKASQGGQFRLAYEVTDDAGNNVAGERVFTIAGPDTDSATFHFDTLELVPDKREYAPGEEVQLSVNSQRPGSHVLLFVRPHQGIYLPPRILKLDGKQTVVPITVRPTDQPNFFVEALSIADARVHSIVREIFVPPADYVDDVEAVVAEAEVSPGGETQLEIRTGGSGHDDADQGADRKRSVVVAVYDKSLEYISGGSNVPPIKPFFWNWRRHHQINGDDNLSRTFANIVPPGKVRMRHLGILGESYVPVRADVLAFGARTGAPSLFADRDAESSDLGLVMSKVAADERTPRDDIPTPQIRSRFADAAFWVADLETNEQGLAELQLALPENLTTWKVAVWAFGKGTRVGQATTEVVTTKDLILRLSAPRFLIEGDEVLLSAHVHNYLKQDQQVQVRLELDGHTIETPSIVEHAAQVAAEGEARVEWRIKARHEGEARLRVIAVGEDASDAIETRLPVYVRGSEIVESFTGVIEPQHQAGQFRLDVPADRLPEQTRLVVEFTPSVAAAMVKALPYLIEYPYGCTEQTLNRFLPAVLAQRTIIELGIDQQADLQRAPELDGAGERDTTAPRPPAVNPMLDGTELSEIVATGVARLAEMQLADGGWGWFSGQGERSAPHTTALVLRGLLLATENDVAVPSPVVMRGLEWLESYRRGQLRRLQNFDGDGKVIDKSRPAKRHADNLDALVQLVLSEADRPHHAMQALLLRDRRQLSVYGLTLLGLTLHKQDRGPERDAILANIDQYVKQDHENQTAHLDLPANEWWQWYGSEFEAHALYLKLLVATQPDHPRARQIVKYLINHRRHGARWNSTRDTALVIEALADYLAATKEGRNDVVVEIWLDGERRKQVAIAANEIWTDDHQFALEGEDLAEGEHTVEIRRAGGGSLYYSASLSMFSLEERLPAAGLDLRVERRYSRLVPREQATTTAARRGQPAERRVAGYRREPLEPGAALTSGDLVEVELILDSKNDYEYVLVEDRKPAGLEPISQRSGYEANDLGAYVEYRDERVGLFITRLARGRQSLRYRLRAEAPGVFTALPATAAAMYAPRLRGNSSGESLEVRPQ